MRFYTNPQSWRALTLEINYRKTWPCFENSMYTEGIIPLWFFFHGHPILNIIKKTLYCKKNFVKYIHLYLIDITERNFGLIHVYFLYTVFCATYRALTSKVTCLLNYLKKKTWWGMGGGFSVLVVYSWHFILR